MDSSPRPKANPRLAAMTKSKRPKQRSQKAMDAAFDAEMSATVARANKNAQPDKMASGGICRGMGAATKGGKFSRSA